MSRLAAVDIQCPLGFETRSRQENNKVCVYEYIYDSRADNHMDRMTERLRLRRPNNEKTNLDSAIRIDRAFRAASTRFTYDRTD